MNRWELTDELYDKYYLNVATAIHKIEHEEIDNKSYSDTELNPYTLGEILIKMGYEDEAINYNGWQMDFSREYTKDGHKTLLVWGTGITFELNLGDSECY